MSEKAKNIELEGWWNKPSAFLFSMLYSKWKYLVVLLLALCNEYYMEFSKLSEDDKNAIIESHIIAAGEDLELEKAKYSAENNLLEIKEYLNSSELEVYKAINSLSDFVSENRGVGYKNAKDEISSIEWFHWDLYFITNSFVFLCLILFLAFDGNKYHLYGDPLKPLLYESSRFAFKSIGLIWCLYDFTSNIITRSERLFKSEVLLCVVVVYILSILAVIWEDIKKKSIKDILTSERK